MQGLKLFLIENGESRAIEGLPTTVPVSFDSSYSVEAYWGKKRLVKPINFDSSKSEQAVEITPDDAWRRVSGPQPEPPSRRPNAAVYVSPSDENAKRWARQVKPSLLACVTADTKTGKGAFTMRPGGTILRSSQNTLDPVALACMTTAIKRHAIIGEAITLQVAITD
jgi:hypothetical protein